MDENKGGDSSPEQQHPDIYPDDPYGSPIEKAIARITGGSGSGGRTPPPSSNDEDDGDDEGMLRMSFFDHLSELRTRIIRALIGFGVVFLGCLVFSNELWLIVQQPAVEALNAIAKNGGVKGNLVGIDPMEQFSIVWMWTPLVASIFLGSPWIIYQVWAFIAPGLYKRERKWAVPFVLITAGLFITGGLFAYFVAFRYGLTFLLGIGKFAGIVPTISIDKYFELFVDVMLGVSLIFEMPVVIFFLVLLRIATPKFLMDNSRYAILAIVIIAAIVTPTPDAFNLMLFAVPMCMLFFVGVFAGYLLVLKREKRKFPWGTVLKWLFVILLIAAAVVFVMMTKFHYHFVKHWPFLIK